MAEESEKTYEELEVIISKLIDEHVRIVNESDLSNPEFTEVYESYLIRFASIIHSLIRSEETRNKHARLYSNISTFLRNLTVKEIKDSREKAS